MNNSPGGTGTAATETRTSAPAPAASTAAASTVQASTVPASTVPASTVPASTVPASTVPASTVPASTVPASTGAAATRTPEPLYGGRATRRVTVSDLAKAKARGEKWPMLTAYDALTGHVFDEAGIPVLLVGDSASMVVFGHDSTIPVTLDELIPLTAAVVRGTSRALIVADLPFGSYQASPAAALAAGIRFLKEAGAHAVKLEGGRRVLPQAEELVAAGIPVMGHLGLTPQSVNVFGGYRVQGRGEDGEQLLQDAKALEAAGAFAVVLECVPAELAARVTKAVSIPTIGIGAGPDCDAQVLVWQDMAGLSPRTPKFVKRYADVAGVLGRAAQSFAEEVTGGQFPTEEYSYR
jgi:3-methyl-2-oxobutanoate hydroxymethyltransferase